MTIEVKSIANPRRSFSPRRLWHNFSILHDKQPNTRRLLLLRFIGALIFIALIAGGDALLGSYKYYSRIVDERLASGYLTSRPGLYAAARSIQAGQKLSPAGLVVALRRAGYVRSEGSNVWSGSFRETDSAVEIRPSANQTANQTRSDLVTINFESDNRISSLTVNGMPIETFTLEPEVLSNDISSKGGKREAVRFTEMPPVLVHAILSTEDHRFFEHSGLDLLGIGRAIVSNAGDDHPGRVDRRLPSNS